MNTQTPPPGVSQDEFSDYLLRKERRDSQRSAVRGDGVEMSALMAELAKLPPETDEERRDREKRLADFERIERLARFRRVCPPEFMQTIDRGQLLNAKAFDSVASWDGRFPGPLAVGTTGTAKTRACWSALCRLNVKDNRSVAWFPVKRLITEFARYESKDIADEFWKMQRTDLIMVDDLDKINWQFESEAAILFQFYDWVYREHRPCMTTTNKSREWWTEKMGEAFARRLFDEAHRTVDFTP